MFQRVHVSLLRLKPCVQLQWNVQESDQWHRYGDPISWDPSLGFKPICAIAYNEFLIDSSILYQGAALFRHLQEEPNSIFLRSISEIRNIQCQTNLSNYPVLSKPLMLVVPQIIGVFARKRHYGRLLVFHSNIDCAMHTGNWSRSLFTKPATRKNQTRPLSPFILLRIPINWAFFGTLSTAQWKVENVRTVDD